MGEKGGHSGAPMRKRLSELADATTDRRDRYVDFLRAFSITVVILGHWLGAVVEWHGGQITGASALDLVPGLWIITWALQVMPVFFFVGGFSNMVTYNAVRRLDEGVGAFLRGRAGRLLRPVVIFLLFWAIVALLALPLLDLPDEAASLAAQVLLVPLWFLFVFLVLVLLTPLMVFLHNRYRRSALVALVVLPVVVDLLRFAAEVPGIGRANYLFVWLLIHQLGFFYADGTFGELSKRFFGLMAAGGYLVMIVLVQLETYPASMVGCCQDRISNMAPPTLPIMALGIGQVGLAMLLRPALTRWLAKSRPWKTVVLVNASIMTLYLWHLSALVITIAILIQLGFPQPALGSGLWWLLRPLWFGAVVLILAGLVFVWGRFERPDLDPAERYWNLKEFYAL
ncbi:MAG: acyltransferase [Actinobacteria bacterium]|nr:acyltransferase [Actinomycetota bacterium]